MTFHVASTLRVAAVFCRQIAKLWMWVSVSVRLHEKWCCFIERQTFVVPAATVETLGNVSNNNAKSVVSAKTFSKSSTLCTKSLTYKTNAKWRDFWEYWILLSISYAPMATTKENWTLNQKQRKRDRIKWKAIHSLAPEWMNGKSATKTLVAHQREKRVYHFTRKVFDAFMGSATTLVTDAKWH